MDFNEPLSYLLPGNVVFHTRVISEGCPHGGVRRCLKWTRALGGLWRAGI